MILKYKLDNGAWRFVSLNDFTSCKVDTTNLYNKYIDEKNDKLDFSYTHTNGLYDAYREFENLFEKAAFYNLDNSNFKAIIYNKDIINKYTNYLVVSYNEKYDLILYDEAYLVSDEGKTIEKLM